QTFLSQAEGDILFDREMRKERVALKHHVDSAPVWRHAGKVFAVEQNPPLLRSLEAGEKPQQCGLAASGRTEQGEKFAFENIKRDHLDRCHTAKTLADHIEAHERASGGIRPWRELPARAPAIARKMFVVSTPSHAGTLEHISTESTKFLGGIVDGGQNTDRRCRRGYSPAPRSTTSRLGAGARAGIPPPSPFAG